MYDLHQSWDQSKCMDFFSNVKNFNSLFHNHVLHHQFFTKYWLKPIIFGMTLMKPINFNKIGRSWFDLKVVQSLSFNILPYESKKWKKVWFLDKDIEQKEEKRAYSTSRGAYQNFSQYQPYFPRPFRIDALFLFSHPQLPINNR